jgi:hypothetical protein
MKVEYVHNFHAIGRVAEHLPTGFTWGFTKGQRLTDCPGAHARQYVAPELRIR